MRIEDQRGQAAVRVVERLRGAGYAAFLAGGCVRDLLLGRPPKDYDVATAARPGEVLALFPGSRAVGAHFGVVLVDGTEVATFRSDHNYRDGRRPESVSFENDPRADVARRDFTINALLYDPVSDEVLDYAGGRRDLEGRVIRAIGDPAARFGEDHLRLLRAVRFAARLGFTVEPATLEAMRQQRASIHAVSAERVRDELVRILTEGGARYGFELLDESGLLAEILPEVAAMKGVAQPPEFHPEGDVWTHTLLLLGQLRNPPATLALAALLHDVGKPATFRVADRIRFDGHAEAGARLAAAILARLRFSAAEIETVTSLVAQHMRFLDVQRMKESTLKRFLRQPDFDQLLELHRLDCAAGSGFLGNYEYVRTKQAMYAAEALKPPPLLRGEDLMALGFRPGPLYREILDAVEDAQLEGTLESKEDALGFVRSRWSDGAVGEDKEDQHAHHRQDTGGGDKL